MLILVKGQTGRGMSMGEWHIKSAAAARQNGYSGQGLLPRLSVRIVYLICQ